MLCTTVLALWYNKLGFDVRIEGKLYYETRKVHMYAKKYMIGMLSGRDVFEQLTPAVMITGCRGNLACKGRSNDGVSTNVTKVGVASR